MRSAVDKSADGERSTQGEVLVFRLREQEFCVNATSVKEIRAWAPAALLPHSPPYLLGVINLRGTVLPIVDMAVRLNFPAGGRAQQPVIVVVWVDGKQIGLLVDAVCDIIAIDPSVVQPTPQLLSSAALDLVSSLVNVGNRVIGLLTLDRILALPEADAP